MLRKPTAPEIWRDLEGRRIELPFRVCHRCDGRDGVLLRHHCKHELELYCDWCEAFTGHRISYVQVLAWVEHRSWAGAPENAILSGAGITPDHAVPHLSR
jgi:hypothetical protein